MSAWAWVGIGGAVWGAASVLTGLLLGPYLRHRRVTDTRPIERQDDDDG